MEVEHIRVFVALGSNIGDRLDTLERACDELHKLYGELRVSQLYQTEPQDCPEGSPAFLNACVELHTQDTPQQLLASCQAIESQLGRQRSGIYGEPRSCDIDIISYGEHIQHEPVLILPHPRAAERSFVLQPLCDLDPDLTLAGQTQSVSQLLAALPDPPELLPTIYPL